MAREMGMIPPPMPPEFFKALEDMRNQGLTVSEEIRQRQEMLKYAQQAQQQIQMAAAQSRVQQQYLNAGAANYQPPWRRDTRPLKRFRMLVEVEFDSLDERAAQDRAMHAFSNSIGNASTTVLMCEPVIDEKDTSKPV